MTTLQEFGFQIVSTSLHFLAERHDVWWSFQIKMLVAPHLSGRTAACLYLVDQISRVILHKHDSTFILYNTHIYTTLFYIKWNNKYYSLFSLFSAVFGRISATRDYLHLRLVWVLWLFLPRGCPSFPISQSVLPPDKNNEILSRQWCDDGNLWWKSNTKYCTSITYLNIEIYATESKIICSFTWAKQRSSSCSFSWRFSCNGYL